MEEFIDLYRYLARCLVEIDSLEISNLAKLIKKLNPLVASEKSGKILVDMLVVSIETSDKEKIKASLKLAMSSILKLEVAFGTEPSGNEQVEEQVAFNSGSPSLLNSNVLATYGTYKVWPEIFEQVWKKLKQKFTTSDIAPLIQEFYKEHLDKHLSLPTAKAYAGAYVKYMLEEKLTSDEGDFSYVKLPQNDEKDPVDEPLNKDEPSVNEPKDESIHEDKLRDKFVKNEFENFQNRILEAAKSNGWDQISIEKIEESFKVTKNETQVQKALGKLLVKEKIMQLPPTHADIIDAEKNNKPKPKGYIRFISYKK
jgi:hypothetical protein